MNVKTMIRGSKSPSDKLSSFKAQASSSTAFSKPINLSQPRKKPLSIGLRGSFKDNQRSYIKGSILQQGAKLISNSNKQVLGVPKFDRSVAMFSAGRPRSSSKKQESVIQKNIGKIENLIRTPNGGISLNKSPKGPSSNQQTVATLPSGEVTRADFRFHMIVGRGGFGKVWVVTHGSSGKYFALKEMSKAKILAKKSVSSVLNERKILGEIRGNFLANMKWAFQDRSNLYLGLDLLTGGDLRFHLCNQKHFSETSSRFIVACVLLALKPVHQRGFLHRDLKPENLVFDEKGYLCLTDFGIARRVQPDNARETSGTPGYMAPEVMCRQNHGREVDYYALGVILHECMLGKRPYDGRSRKEVRDQILARQALVSVNELPRGWNPAVIDFINRLLQRKANRRLGFNGISEVISHPWFSSFDWEGLEKKTMTPPFSPDISEVFDYLKSLTEDGSEDEEEENEMAHYELQLRQQATQDLFNEYDIKKIITHQQKELIKPRESSISSLKTNRLGSGVLGPSRLKVERSESGSIKPQIKLEKSSFAERFSNSKKISLTRSKVQSNNIPPGIYTKLENIWKNNSKRIA